MSTWRYQTVKHSSPEETCYGIHEVYYSDNDEYEGMSEEALVVGDTIEGLRSEITRMFECTVLLEVIDEDGKPTNEPVPSLQTRK
jgi:hypothetical protein